MPFKNHISQENDNDYLADDLSDFETENTEEQAAPTYQRSKGYHEKAKKQPAWLQKLSRFMPSPKNPISTFLASLP